MKGVLTVTTRTFDQILGIFSLCLAAGELDLLGKKPLLRLQRTGRIEAMVQCLAHVQFVRKYTAAAICQHPAVDSAICCARFRADICFHLDTYRCSRSGTARRTSMAKKQNSLMHSTIVNGSPDTSCPYINHSLVRGLCVASVRCPQSDLTLLC